MAYRYEQNKQGKNDIIIDGFEKGIAESPYLGIASMKNLNIKFLPGATYVNYKRQRVSTVSNNGVYTANHTANTITSTEVTLRVGDAFTVSATLYGLTAGTIYFVKAGSKVSETYGGADVTLTSSGTGSITLIGMTEPQYWTYDIRSGYYYVTDVTGRVWQCQSTTFSSTAPMWTLLKGNTNGGKGIAIWKGYLFVFGATKIDVCGTGTYSSITSANWIPNWQTISSGSHYTCNAIDEYLYFCNGQNVGSIAEVYGKTFEPGTPSTFNFNVIALLLPSYVKETKWITELKDLLLIAEGKKIWTWNKRQPGPNYPIPIKEEIVSMTNLLNKIYVLAGVKGNIYLSNGYSCEPWRKIPDSFFDVIDPQITWGDCMGHRNRLYAGMWHSNKGTYDGTAGIISVDIDTGVVNFENQTSSSLNSAPPKVLIEIESATNDSYFSSYGYYTGGDYAGAMDYNNTTLYTNWEPVIETDFIPIGTRLQPTTLEHIEFKLDKPLSTNDEIRLSARTSLGDSYTLLGTTTSAILSDIYPFNLYNAEWIQIKAEFKGGSNNVRLREIRLHLT